MNDAQLAVKNWDRKSSRPASLRRNWQLEWEKFVGIKAMILNDSVKKTWPTFYGMECVRFSL